MKKKIFIFLILAMFLFVGCQKNIILKNDEKEDKVVIKDLTQYSDINNTIIVNNRTIRNFSNIDSISFFDVDDSDLIIVDSDKDYYPKKEIEKIKKNKFIFNYVDIGKINENHSFWQIEWNNKKPSFFYDKDDEGNYYVKYWSKEWQLLIMEKIVNSALMGYDGVYLDNTETYSYFKSKRWTNTEDLLSEMFLKIKTITKEQTEEPFYIITSNMPFAYEYSNISERIDGMLIEDIWYENGEVQDRYVTNKSLEVGKSIIDNEGIVISMDSSGNSSYLNICNKSGFICLKN
jgi:uncharacterized protein (TIGR01370 family)